MEKVIGTVFLVFIITFVIFLILRELMCWYWKINHIITLLEKISSRLAYIGSNNVLTTSNTHNVRQSEGTIPTVDDDNEICPFCKEPSSKVNKICEICGKQKR